MEINNKSNQILSQNITNAFEGQSVALSNDQKTLVVGMPGYNSNAGAILIYEKVGTSWNNTPSFFLTQATVNALEGYSMSISGDGNTIANWNSR